MHTVYVRVCILCMYVYPHHAICIGINATRCVHVASIHTHYAYQYACTHVHSMHTIPTPCNLHRNERDTVRSRCVHTYADCRVWVYIHTQYVYTYIHSMRTIPTPCNLHRYGRDTKYAYTHTQHAYTHTPSIHTPCPQAIRSHDAHCRTPP